MKRLFFIISAILIFCTTLKGQGGLLSGLYFSSYEVVQDQRTSLDLTPHKPFEFPGGFSIEFDINIRRDDGYYGYIFRMIGDHGTNIDLVSNMASTSSNFWLVYKDEILLSYKWDELPSFDYDQWIKVRIDFDFKEMRLALFFNEKRQEATIPSIEKLTKFFISFGACKYKSFYSTDVCPMTIRNIRIYEPENHLYRHWELSKHAQNKVYDSVANAEALAENPHWLIDRYLKWREAKQFTIHNLLGVTSDATNKRLFLVSDKKVYTLSLETWQLDSVSSSGSPYFDPLGKNVIYNKYTHEIWSYSFAGPVSRFDFRTNEWSPVQPDSILAEYAHHNRFFSPVDSSLITILGYGYYEYKGMVNIYDPTMPGWKKINRSDQITPRYLSSAGFLNDEKVLVFGGYGSKSGRQELSPMPYYDLYSFDLKNLTFNKKWSLMPPTHPFVPSETLVADASSGVFYTLSYNNGYYNTYLRLAEFSIHEPKMKFLGDSIPFKYKDTDSWVYLYLNEHKSDLIAVVSHLDNLSIYTLAYKPLMPEDTIQSIPPVNGLAKWKIVIFITLLLISIYVIGKGIMLLTTYYKRRKGTMLMPLPAIEKTETSSFYLLGEFCVYSKKGENITSSFTPTLQQLFLLILLSSINKKGIHSNSLDEALWHDKIGDSARNNRNVNLNKLRSLLDEAGNIKITNTNSVWNIYISEDVHCDYLDIVSFVTKVKNAILLEEEDICHFLSLVSAGDLLPDIATEWISVFKNTYTKDIIDTLTTLLNVPVVQRDLRLLFYTAKSLLAIDSLNDEALSIVCSTLQKLNKHSLAKLTYDSFVKEYKKGTGTPYPVSFNALIRKA